jgi:hypothetical protein
VSSVVVGSGPLLRISFTVVAVAVAATAAGRIALEKREKVTRVAILRIAFVSPGSTVVVVVVVVVIDGLTFSISWTLHGQNDVDEEEDEVHEDEFEENDDMENSVIGLGKMTSTCPVDTYSA